MNIKERLLNKKIDNFCRNVKKDELYSFIIFLLIRYNKNVKDFNLLHCFNEITDFYYQKLEKGEI